MDVILLRCKKMFINVYMQDEQYSELDSFVFMKNHRQNMLDDIYVSMVATKPLLH